MTRFLRATRLACFPLMLAMAGAAVAQNFPSRTMSLMVPYPAGGLSDVIARTVAPQLSKGVGQPVIVENLAGAGGSVAAQKVLNTAADGHGIADLQAPVDSHGPAHRQGSGRGVPEDGRHGDPGHLRGDVVAERVSSGGRACGGHVAPRRGGRG